MKKIKLTLLLLTCILSFIGCEDNEPDVLVNSSSIIPSTTEGRTNVNQGCVETDSRIITVSLWDHGTVDGDIVSLFINDRKVVNEITLDGPNNKYNIDLTLENNGYNYISLYAHNLGDISPNTAAISINGEEFSLESNLNRNGAFDVIVTGFDVTCFN